MSAVGLVGFISCGAVLAMGQQSLGGRGAMLAVVPFEPWAVVAVGQQGLVGRGAVWAMVPFRPWGRVILYISLVISPM
jgi:hypothetical protein